jgi:hypothetical protein
VDLPLLGRVLWRHKLVVGIGLFGAIALAFLSLVRVSPNGDPALSYRQHEKWQSIATIFVSEHGFPVGRTRSPDGSDPTRFSTYALLYARLAISDPVKKIMYKDGPIDPSIDLLGAAPVLAIDSNNNSAPLPLVNIWTVSNSSTRSSALTKRLTSAFLTYIENEQRANNIPPDQKVTVTVVTDGSEPLLIKKRSKTLPMVVFLTVALATCGLAFMLENFQRRRRPAAVEGPAVQADALRSA